MFRYVRQIYQEEDKQTERFNSLSDSSRSSEIRCDTAELRNFFNGRWQLSPHKEQRFFDEFLHENILSSRGNMVKPGSYALEIDKTFRNIGCFKSVKYRDD